MLYDKRWEKPEAAVELEPWQKTLLAAADLIEREGWIQGRRYKQGVGYCVLGAVSKIATGDPDNWWPPDTSSALSRCIKHNNPIAWNDIQGRTKADVIQLLRQAVKEV